MKIIIKHLFILLFLGLIPCGCDNDPASPTEEHTDADGFILEDESGNEIYREFEGASSDSVIISVGQTLELSVHFLDHDGNEIEHDEEEDGHGIHMPSPSYIPLITALGLAVFGYGLIYSFVMSGVGAFVTVVGIYAWAMEPATAPED